MRHDLAGAVLVPKWSAGKKVIIKNDTVVLWSILVVPREGGPSRSFGFVLANAVYIESFRVALMVLFNPLLDIVSYICAVDDIVITFYVFDFLDIERETHIGEERVHNVHSLADGDIAIVIRCIEVSDEQKTIAVASLTKCCRPWDRLDRRRHSRTHQCWLLH